MLERALEAGVPAGWVAADAVYGNSPALRGWLEGRQLPCVLAVKCTESLPSASGPPASAARLAKRIPPVCWLRLSAGHGAKSRRWRCWYRWVTLAMVASGSWWWPRPPSTPATRHRWG
jgi:SRSO17 transposase